MTDLYPPIEPYDTGFLKVSDLHTIYYEQCGHSQGKPVLMIHGGPGGGIEPSYRRYFDPAIYRIILVDQRGCGQSTPLYELQENNTHNLIADFATLRSQLKIEQWMLFGGSWGSTLALAYAEAHPTHVSEMVLRGIFLGSDFENQWLFGGQGANYIFPQHWHKFISIIPEDERHDVIAAYYKRLTDPEPAVRQEAADAWSAWEVSVCQLVFDQAKVDKCLAQTTGISLATLECHYMMNHCFLEPDQLLKNIDKIRHIPTIIVHGQYDIVCAAHSAWLLHQAWPESELNYVPAAGHTMSEKGIISQLVDATDRLKAH